MPRSRCRQRSGAYWTEEGNASRAPQGQQPTFQNTKRIFGPIADKVTKYEWGKEVAPGILAQDTNGHTPGHTAFVVASGSGKVLIQADVTAGYAPLVVANPTWQVGGDMDGTQAEATRRKLYDMLAADRMLVSGYHFPFPLARLYREGGQRLSPDPGELESGALRRGFCLNSAVGPSRDKPGDGPDRYSRRLAPSGHWVDEDARRRYGARP